MGLVNFCVAMVFVVELPLQLGDRDELDVVEAEGSTVQSCALVHCQQEPPIS